MAGFEKAPETVRCSQNPIEVEIVSDEEFKMLDEAIQNAMTEAAEEKEKNTADVEKEEDMHNNFWSTRFLTPLDRFRGGVWYLSVSDLTAQYWCEQQMEYNFLAPESKPETEQMQLGKNIHLAREMELYDLVDIKIESKEDKWAATFLDCLTKVASLDAKQTVRELPVLGEPFGLGVFVYGIIDELRFNESGQLELLELKTRAGSSLPSRAQQSRTFLQAMLYSILFNDLLEGKLDIAKVMSKLQINGDAVLSEDVNKWARECRIPCNMLTQIGDLMLKRFKSSDIQRICSIVIEYISQVSHEVINKVHMDLDEDWTKSKLVTMLPYWKGEREAVGVDIEEAWKCHRCEFADMCVWRMKKDKECRSYNKAETN